MNKVLESNIFILFIGLVCSMYLFLSGWSFEEISGFFSFILNVFFDSNFYHPIIYDSQLFIYLTILVSIIPITIASIIVYLSSLDKNDKIDLDELEAKKRACNLYIKVIKNDKNSNN